MVLLKSSAISLLVVVSLSICCGQNVGNYKVKIINPAIPSTRDKVHLVYHTTESVICVVTRALLNPVVVFGFEDQTIDEDLKLTPAKQVESVNNRYNVNVTIRFNATSNMHKLNLVCSLAGQVWKATIDMYFPPVLTLINQGDFTSTYNFTLERSCESISVPESSLEWYMFDVPLVRSGYYHIEKQTCEYTYTDNFGRNSLKYICRSTVTVFNLTKDLIDATLKCSANYLGRLSTSVEEYMDFYYPPTEISVDSKPIKAVDATSDGIVEMTCTTNAANPAPKLIWIENISMMKRLNVTEFPAIVTKTPEYNSHVIEQTVEVSVNKEMNGNTLYCCSDMPLTEEFTGICASTTILVPWLTSIYFPVLENYKVYKGTDLIIPCLVDSHPVSVIEWYKDKRKISDNKHNKTNIFELHLPNVQIQDIGSYNCTAILYVDGEPLHTLFKSFNLFVIDIPSLPTVHVIDRDYKQYPVIVMTTPPEPSLVPRTFYIQYKKYFSPTWLELTVPFSDSLPGQRSLTHVYEASNLALESGYYKVRVKSLTFDGMEAFTIQKSFHVKEDKGDDEVTKSSRDVAICVSFFVTTLVFITIIVVGVCLMKRGVFGEAAKNELSEVIRTLRGIFK